MVEIRRARPEDYVTMRVSVTPAKGTTPRWDKFLDETFCRDGELIKAVKRILGYGVTGEVFLRKAFVLDGQGKNGKSTLCRVMRTILGDYGYASSSRIIGTSYSGHDTVFAALEKKRFIEIPETDHTLILGERFKILTGNDTIVGRGMREDERPILIHGKLFICANNNIKFDATSKSVADRLIVIPFRHEVKDPDPLLYDKLMEEAPAILYSLLEEVDAFYADKALLASKAIAEATRVYVGNADRYDYFLVSAGYVEIEDADLPAIGRQMTPARTAADLKDRLLRARENATIPSKCPGLSLQSIFTEWKAHAEAEGDYVGNSKLLAQALRERGYAVKFHEDTRTAFVAGIRKL